MVEDGRIAECGTHDELIAADGLYRRFVKIREKAENSNSLSYSCRPHIY